VIYLVRTLRLKQQTPLQHVEAVRRWGLRWMWPRDGSALTLARESVWRSNTKKRG
jgi:hypothetical protein